MRALLRRVTALALTLLLLASCAGAENLRLYTYPAGTNTSDTNHYPSRNNYLMIRGMVRAMGGAVIMAYDSAYRGISLFFWQDGMTEMRCIEDSIYYASNAGSMAEAEEMCEDRMSSIPLYKMPDLTHALSFIVSDGETLYGYNELNNLVFTIEETADGVTYHDVVTIADDELLWVSDVDSEQEAYRRSLRPLGVWENTMLLYSIGGEHESLMTFDLTDGSIRSIPVERLMMAYDWQPGQALLWIQKEENGIICDLYVYDAASDTQTLLQENVTVGKWESGIYDTDTGAYLAVRQQQVIATTDFAVGQALATMPEACAYIACTENSIIGATFTSVYVRDRNASASATMRIWGNDGLDAEAVTEFVEQHPEISLAQETESTLRLKAKEIAEAFAQEDAPDILLMTLRDSIGEADGSWALDALLEEEALADLSFCEEAVTYGERLNTVFRDAVMKDGKMYALPLHATSTGGFFANRELMQKIGLTDEDIPTSLTELCAFITRWNDEYTEKYAAYAPLDETEDYRERMLDLMVREWIGYCQANGMALTFDHPIFREMMDALDNMRADKIEQQNEHVNEDDSDYKQPLIWTNGTVVSNFSNYNVSDASRYFLRMTLTPEPDFCHGITQMTVLMVNPNTQNRALISELIALALSRQSEENQCVLLRDYEQPVEYSSYALVAASYESEIEALQKELETVADWHKSSLKSRIAELQEEADRMRVADRWALAPDTITLYQQTILPVSYLRRPGILVRDTADTLGDLMARKVSGELSTEDFIAQADALLASLGE